MKPGLVELLFSPLDRSKLRLEVTDQTDGEVMAGEFIDASGKQYPIVEGVPLFAEEVGTDETFSFKWKLIGDSYGYEKNTRLNRQNWYLERFGFDTRDDLLNFLKTKKMVLDAGIGSGVDVAMFAESGTTVIAIDLSKDAALATYRHLSHLPNVHVLQADLCALPFQAGVFDFISCDQVLHHTVSPTDSFAALARHLCRGGHIAIYVYRHKGSIREFTDDYLRNYTTKMTAQDCYKFC